MSGRPVVLPAAAGECLGWFHAGALPRRRVAVVMCRPLGYEALCSYRTYTQLAHTLAAAGFDVLRFDYHGTGDSAGGDADAGRVEAWLDTVAVAMREAKRLAGTDEVALFGMRLGATLALEAAQRAGGVHSLMLWAPCASGRGFVREMRAAFGSHGDSGPQGGGLEALGTLFTGETLAAIEQLAPDRARQAPAQRALVVARDDIPGEGPLPGRLRALGVQVTTAVWPGYSDMMAEPHDARLAPDTLAAITAWLGEAHPRRSDEPALAPSAAASWRCGGVVETGLSFGADGRLFGVVSRSLAAAGPNDDAAVLLLNVGGNYRVGPNRVYVKLARELASAGWRVLRMDVTGIGDSRIEEGFSSDSMYREDATADVSAAIDMLMQRGVRRVFLLGICSGAYLAFQTALQDARVTGQMIVNARLLEWDAGRNGPWQTSMQSYYKSTRYYKQALLRGEVYGRLLRGEIDVRGIARRFADLALARLRRLGDRLVGRPPREGVLAKMKHLGHRGVDTLVAMSEQDDGLDYIEFHLGSGGARLRGQANFRMVLVPRADHTFSTVESQQALQRIVREHLEHLRSQPAETPGVLAHPVATT